MLADSYDARRLIYDLINTSADRRKQSAHFAHLERSVAYISSGNVCPDPTARVLFLVNATLCARRWFSALHEDFTCRDQSRRGQRTEMRKSALFPFSFFSTSLVLFTLYLETPFSESRWTTFNCIYIRCQTKGNCTFCHGSKGNFDPISRALITK